jgi:hypothetical protein
MTQFILSVPEPAVVAAELDFGRRVGRGDESWLEQIARAVFPEESDVRIPHLKDGRSIGNIFTDAHNALYNGREPSAEFRRVLRDMATACRSFVLWWGSDWEDLPTVESESALITEVVRQLRDPVGEVYIRWKRRGQRREIASIVQ